MTELPRLILTREHIQHGLTAKELARRCRSGALVRLRQGVYVDGGVWRALTPWDQYRVRVGAAAETFVARTIFARHSAASVWRIPTIGLRHPIHALTLQNDGGRSRAGVLRHYAPPAGLKCVRREGILVTGRIRTVLDLAAFTPFAEAVVPVDHVLKPDTEQRLPALTKELLLAGIEGNYTAAAARRVRAAVEFADPRSGSAGESYSRALMWVAGFQAPELQAEFRDDSGLVGYTDYYWDRVRVAGEFDGTEKYVKPEYLKGRTVSQTVVDEKERENRVRALGNGMVRWVWADLMAAGQLERKLAAAGVPRRRARSAQ
ncbi:type IV toxin-antitoxin system AbiEi family antitoxin domain-containing protein [Arthrobacter sp. PsM3]|uniref:type IV toxin-antitoxin system AbiEi family antitoxin domain-containing protein n=1 Tax=Arthrobacter sp. PsM3 TaxID=3030531 RepID=UPI00263BD9FF|nr:type IV toxin-antitoxin system AbiEi family antitoxin domain-containing protein [Arthrobacter sp. PsM3]MDN4645920.1 type IV toxin-antitoxin system AbiEi family antitoxin domain-containing protein [Arthrobacter sp. PsM3]